MVVVCLLVSVSALHPIFHQSTAPSSLPQPFVDDLSACTRCRGKLAVLSASGSTMELQRPWHPLTNNGSFHSLSSLSQQAGSLSALSSSRNHPRWLFSRGRREEGIRNLCWLRMLNEDDVYMQEEISAIDNALEEQRSTVGLGFWQPFHAVFADRKTRYRILLGGSLFFWQNATGINAINYYSPTVFKSIGITGTNTSLLTTGIFGVIKTVITLFWLFYLIDKLGRRGLLMFGAVAGSLCMWYIGGYIAVSDPASKAAALKAGENLPLGSGGISAMVFFYLWTATYTPSWNGTPWVLNSEMFNQNVRTLAQAFAAANNWFWVYWLLLLILKPC